MGKKVKEYKAGDFIFAKVKGYPAWPARVQKLNGKKYFVYFYGTGETANLPSNMIFDYAENKDKFLTKTQKRKLFNDGVKQIEYDFANNVPVEDVVGGLAEAPMDTTNNETMNDTGNETLNDSAVGDSTLDDTANDSAANTTQSDALVEDSDENGALVIDEGKKGKKKPDPSKTPSKETPKAIAKTPRGRAKKVDSTEKQETEKQEKAEEIVSRSGRKIRPKRFVDEQTEENSTLPSPVAKKRRAATPPPEKEKDSAKDKEKRDKDGNKHFNTVSQSELEDLKEPYVPADPEKQNILITYLPTGQYVGLKLFQSSPSAVTNFKNEGAKLSYDKQQAKHALTLKTQLERGQITPQSIAAQLILDLNLTDEEKATLDKERETEEKKSRVQFLKTEMKLIELDAKIKTCLCLEKADTELCLKLLDELQELTLKPLMLLKHPACVETVKRMRAYVGNTPSWGLSEADALQFSKRAAAIRKQCDAIYNSMKELYTVPDGLSFWEFFSERVLQFKSATSKLNADELLELVHEPLEMTVPTSHTMRAAIDAANNEEKLEEALAETPSKKKNTPAKKKKEPAAEKEKASTPATKPDNTEKVNAKSKKETTDNAKSKKETTDNAKDNAKSKKETTDNAKDNAKSKKETEQKTTDNAKSKKEAEKPTTPTKPTLKRQSSRNKPVEEKTAEQTQDKTAEQTQDKEPDTQTDKSEPEKMDVDNEKEQTQSNNEEAQSKVDEETQNHKETSQETEIVQEKQNNTETTKEKQPTEPESKSDDAKTDTDTIEKNGKDKDDEKKEGEDDKEKIEEKEENEEKEQDKEAKEKEDEPRAKRSRETKKVEAPPPRSPNKRKTKA